MRAQHDFGSALLIGLMVLGLGCGGTLKTGTAKKPDKTSAIKAIVSAHEGEITPHLRGMQDWSHLPYASSLCGACTSVCPVHVDLHHHLFQNRRNAVQQRLENHQILDHFLLAQKLYDARQVCRSNLQGQPVQLLGSHHRIRLHLD